MKIEYATEADYEYIMERDRHIHQPLVKTKMSEKEIFILWDEWSRVGWMRHGYFWDNISFKKSSK